MSDAVTREETLLNAIATGEAVDIVPVTRKEKYLRYLAGIGEKPSKPITREEMFLDKIQAGGGEDEASVLDSMINCTITEVKSNVEIIAGYAFIKRSWLVKADFPKAKEIGMEAFKSTSSLKALILRNNSIVTLGYTNALQMSGIAVAVGYIYVPSALVDIYKSATNWSTYATKFRALEDYTVDGTITGELDESKI